MQIDEKQGVLAQLEQVLSQMARDAAYQEEVFKSQVVDLLMRMSRFAIDRGANASDVLTQNALVIHDLYETIRYDKFVLKVSHYASWLVAQAGSCHWPEVSTVAKQALTFLHRHHHQSVTLDDVANWCCVSKYHLGHMFKEEVGVSIIDYLNQIRIDKAKYYLESSDLPIQQISNSVGFQDANYFSRTFRKVTGQSPRAYRKARLC
jgi:two-component system response regulator YesN